ncbi:SRPBCC family protein [Streptomyces sp. MST-110588]|uniref:SRPBCC family protein n=1 Tax=Streptomyces sp. MST-110588 TaxID=2833628 RepID=UPI001F5CC0D1|nr:SRPBCC family protein [Streptomyces sp. MST-110588]UNO43494.1 SRPBCC family protein [Streptomyces sp. MST-110588]
MAIRHVLIPASVDAVWSVLCDGDKYQQWVVGPTATEQVDDHWPQPGAAVRYRVGPGQGLLKGRTVVRICVPRERLELEARAGRLGSARIAIRLLPWGEECIVIIDEHPLRGIGAHMHNVVLDAFLHARHRRMLVNLRNLVVKTVREGQHGPAAHKPP